MIGSEYVYLLREKQCVGIWCMADVFFNKYKLKGFYTGMIISEMEEAYMYCIHQASPKDVNESNTLFTNAITNSIMSESMLTEAKAVYYSDTNPIISFNQDNLYER